MKAVQIREPVNIGKVVRNALLFKFRDPREGAVSDRALLEAVERLFALLEERRIAYLLVGHIALLQYVESRNTDNIDLIMSRSSLDRLPELHKTGQDGDLIRAAFEGIQIHLLLTSNPLFDEVRRRHATRQRFVEREIPCATPQPPTPRRKHLKAGFRATNTVSVIREALGQKAFRLKSAVNAAVLDAVMVGGFNPNRSFRAHNRYRVAQGRLREASHQ